MYLHSQDMLVIQEHKMRNNKVQQFGSQLWKHVTTWYQEMLLDYNNSPKEERASCSGITIFLSPKWSKLVNIAIGMSVH